MRALFRGFKNGKETIVVKGEKLNGDWVYWDEYGSMVDENGSSTTYNVDMIRVVYVDTAKRLIIPETVGLYTSLVDRNREKVFEGDRINCDIRRSIGTVVIENGNSAVDYDTPLYGIITDEILSYVKEFVRLGTKWDFKED